MSKKVVAMSETAFYILLSLTTERHGYGIMQHVESMTESRIKLGAGTIYGTLGKMEKNGLVKSTKEEDKRKYYVITEEGRDALEYEVSRLRELYENGMKIISKGECKK